MTPAQHKQLSKLMSLVLRHEPQKWNLALDEDGFVPLSEFLAALQTSPRHKRLSENEVREVVRESDKQRFEIVEDAGGAKIRARYGHSVESAVSYEPTEPPEILYHGTSRHAVKAILQDGLQPMKRQYVHLSTEPAQAQNVGARHDHQPIILKVRAREAWQNGVKFYQPEARLFLADNVPPQFIEE